MIESCEEFDACVESAKGTQVPLLVQFGSEVCPRCPQFGEAIAAHRADFKFEWRYVNAHDSELPEHFGITKLPAYVLVVPGEAGRIVVANATEEQLHIDVRAHCPAVLKLDEDF